MRFIWIDCLCIVRDSPQDKHAEIPHVGEYYQNAYITISVLDAAGMNEGFLNTRQPSSAAHEVFPDTDMFIRPTPRRPKQIFQDAMLSKRGWTFQERLLSRRIVNFSRDEIFWECLTCTARESSFKVQNEAPDDARVMAVRRVLFHKNLPLSSSEQLYRIWYMVVQEYSPRILTYPEDKRHAILGIASIIGAKIGTKFLEGGIFANDIAELLSLENSHMVKYFRKPTWSWLSTVCSVYYPFTDKDRIPSPLDARIIDENRVPEFYNYLHLSIRARRRGVKLSNGNRSGRAVLVDKRGRHICTSVSDYTYSWEYLERARLSAIWICQFSYMSNRHVWEDCKCGKRCDCVKVESCVCGKDSVLETVTYFLIIVPDGCFGSSGGRWNKVGVAAAWDRPECENNHL